MDDDFKHSLTWAPEVRLRDVVTCIDDEIVLRGVSLLVPEGKVTVLMGPSGVGKSTLVRNIVGLQRPDDGTVWIGGQDVWAFDPAQWREMRATIGAMIGGSYLVSASTFGSLTVQENLSFTLEAVGVPAEERHERVLARMRELDLMEYHDRTPESLPAHATRRMALGRALITDAPLTILDEIDVGMDHRHSRAVIESIRSFRERTAGTVLLTTHSIALARELGDELVILNRGHVVANGDPEDLLLGITSTTDFDHAFASDPPVLDPSPELLVRTTDRLTSSADARPAAVRLKGRAGLDRLTVLAIVLAVIVIALAAGAWITGLR